MPASTMTVSVHFHSRRLSLGAIASLLSFAPGEGSYCMKEDLHDPRYPAVSARREALRRRQPGSCLCVHSRHWKLPTDVLARADAFSRSLVAKCGAASLTRRGVSVDVIIGLFVKDFVADMRCARSGTRFHPAISSVVVSVYG